MRQIEPEFVYNINELSEGSRYNAFQTLRERRENVMVDSDIADMIKSVKTFAESVGHDFVNYSIYFYLPVRFNLEATTFDTYSVTELVAKINADWPAEVDGACSLTGNYTDCFIYDHFRNIGGTSESTFVSDIEDAVRYALTTLLNELEEALDSEESAVEYAMENGLEFYEDGELYT